MTEKAEQMTETDGENEIINILNELEGESEHECSIYRDPDKNQSALAFCFRFMPGDYTYTGLMEKVQTTWGGGNYRLHVRDGRGLKKNRPFTIAGPGKVDEPTTAAQPGNNNEVVELLKVLITQQQAQTVNTGSSLKESLEHLQLLQGLQRQTDITEEITKVKTIAELMGMGGGAAAPTNGNDLVLELISSLKDIAEVSKQSAASPGANKVTPVHAQLEQANSARLFMQMLEQGAKTGGNPITYAELAADNLDPHVLAAIVNGEMGPLRPYLAMAPGLAVHQDWLMQVRAELVEIVRESTTDDETETPDGTDQAQADQAENATNAASG